MAKKDKAGSEAKGGGGGLVGFLVVTVLAISMGAGFGFFLHGKANEPATPEAKEEKAEADGRQKSAPKPTVSASATLVTLAPIVVNLAEPSDAWIRIEASILVDGLNQGSDLLGAQLAEDISAYLRTMPLSQLEGPSGFLNLREDLVDRAAIRDREHIKDVIIHGVVVE